MSWVLNENIMAKDSFSSMITIRHCFRIKGIFEKKIHGRIAIKNYLAASKPELQACRTSLWTSWQRGAQRSREKIVWGRGFKTPEKATGKIFITKNAKRLCNSLPKIFGALLSVVAGIMMKITVYYILSLITYKNIKTRIACVWILYLFVSIYVWESYFFIVK